MIINASGGLRGGLVNWVTGGSFWDGVKQGLITSALNHAMHMVADGINGGNPQPPYSPDLLVKIQAYAAANGMVTDAAILIYEIGKLENGNVLPFEKAVTRGARLAGLAGTILSTGADFIELKNASMNNKSLVPASLKISVGLTVATKASPQIALAYSIADVLGVTDLIFNQVPKIPAYTKAGVTYGSNKLAKVPQLQYQKLYR